MKRLCLHPGCGKPARSKGRCPEHAKRRDAQIRRAGRKIYSTKRWAMTRRHYLSGHPFCEACCLRLATQVHHRIDLSEGGAPYDPSNLEALCAPCHSGITRARQ